MTTQERARLLAETLTDKLYFYENGETRIIDFRSGEVVRLDRKSIPRIENLLTDLFTEALKE